MDITEEINRMRAELRRQKGIDPSEESQRHYEAKEPRDLVAEFHQKLAAERAARPLWRKIWDPIGIALIFAGSIAMATLPLFLILKGWILSKGGG